MGGEIWFLLLGPGGFEGHGVGCRVFLVVAGVVESPWRGQRRGCSLGLEPHGLGLFPTCSSPLLSVQARLTKVLAVPGVASAVTHLVASVQHSGESMSHLGSFYLQTSALYFLNK